MKSRTQLELLAGTLALAGLAGLFWRSETDRRAVTDLRAEHEALRGELARTTNALKQVVERLDAAAPARQPLRAASANLEIVVRSSRGVKAHDLGCPSRLTLYRGQTPLLQLSAPDCFLEQKGGAQLAWRATVEMEPAHAGSGQPVSALAEADRLEAQIELIDAGAKVLGGSAVVTLNSALRIEVPIPPQTSQSGRVTSAVPRDALEPLSASGR